MKPPLRRLVIGVTLGLPTLAGLAIITTAALPAPSQAAAAPLNGLAGAPSPSSKIEQQVLTDTANGQSTSFAILLADQANVSAGYSMKDQDARGWYVYTTLRDHAAATQAGLRAFLAAQGSAYQSFWVANVIFASGDRALVNALAARSDVGHIEANVPVRGIEDSAVAAYQPPPASSNTIEWGVQNVNAPGVWALGYTGQGIVIGNADTGMQWDHPALKPHYRGWNGTTADHNYNWHDSIHSGGGSCGFNSQAPCDDNGHGTHTTGTTVGDDGAGNQIGVAPGAKWIGTRNMDQGNGTPASYAESFQWFIAPTDLNGNNPNPTLRPHVINNSWGCPSSEGCAPNTLETIVNNTQAAGIFVEVEARSAGPGCETMLDPPAFYAAAFTVGAFDSNNALAGFSSRGPSLYYTPNLLKPEIVAPGVAVRSSSLSNTYATLSGPAMAGPHIAGVVALLWSARPQLSRDITATKQILENTANPQVSSPAQTCGGIPSSQIPNNSFGYGRVDALAAVNSVPLLTPTLSVTSTPPTATRTTTAASATATPTAIPTLCLMNLIVNGEFETGTFPPWVILGTNNPPTVSNGASYSPPYSALLGTCSGTEPNGDSSIYQQIAVPAGSSTLSYWWNGSTTDSITFDWQDAYVTTPSGTILATIMHTCQTTGGWVNQTFNMAPFAGQTVRIEFLVHEDGFGDDTCMYVDDVTLIVPCGPPGPTQTPGGGGTPTRTPTAGPTQTTVPGTNTPTPLITVPPAPTNTPTNTPFASPTFSGCLNTQGDHVECTTTPTYTAPNTPTPVLPTVTPCILPFVDVDPFNPFYVYIRCLYCRGIVSGYNANPPCDSGTPCFRPYNTITRGQFSKMAANAAGYSDPIPSTQQSFTDVLYGSPFWVYIERLVLHGAISGYSSSPPCMPGQVPCFLPGNNLTRSQLLKIVVSIKSYSDPIPTTQQTFGDVPFGNAFWVYAERAYLHGIVSGYSGDGTSINPCTGQIEQVGVLYLRPCNLSTRGQVSKILADAFYSNCPTPARWR